MATSQDTGPSEVDTNANTLLGNILRKRKAKQRATGALGELARLRRDTSNRQTKELLALLVVDARGGDIDVSQLDLLVRELNVDLDKLSFVAIALKARSVAAREQAEAKDLLESGIVAEMVDAREEYGEKRRAFEGEFGSPFKMRHPSGALVPAAARIIEGQIECDSLSDRAYEAQRRADGEFLEKTTEKVLKAAQAASLEITSSSACRVDPISTFLEETYEVTQDMDVV